MPLDVAISTFTLFVMNFFNSEIATGSRVLIEKLAFVRKVCRSACAAE